MAHPLMRYFDVASRTKNPNIKVVGEWMENVAQYMDDFLPDGAEKTVAMRKLLEAKDAACRAALDLPE
jgi:hypothetical protein